VGIGNLQDVIAVECGRQVGESQIDLDAADVER
jgi:hypothetical protein